MDLSYITHPITGKSFSIHSKIGKQILQQYLTRHKTIGGAEEESKDGDVSKLNQIIDMYDNSLVENINTLGPLPEDGEKYVENGLYMLYYNHSIINEKKIRSPIPTILDIEQAVNKLLENNCDFLNVTIIINYWKKLFDY